MSRRRITLAAFCALLTACGGGTDARPEPPRIVTTQVGAGPQAAWIIRPDVDRPLPGVLFLHGWGATRPDYYRPWLDHLAREGNAVIYPRYQESVLLPPAQALGNVIAGVRLALPRADLAPGSLVVAGHSAGGALAADYAALAGVAKLPRPRAVLSMYPGRSLRRFRLRLPEVDNRRVPAGTRVVAMAGARDTVVGTRVARRIARATGGDYVLVRDPAVADHLGPQRSGPATRRIFWRRLDALIRAR
ncbi:MAG TPA: alpha/beta hydrolase fold domain-containing protein [Solirubrobacteraceae bacterium]